MCLEQFYIDRYSEKEYLSNAHMYGFAHDTTNIDITVMPNTRTNDG